MGQVKCHPQSFYTLWVTTRVSQVGGKGCVLPNNTNIFFWLASRYVDALDSLPDVLQDTHPELTDDRLWDECIDTNTPLHVISVKQSDGCACQSRRVRAAEV